MQEVGEGGEEGIETETQRERRERTKAQQEKSSYKPSLPHQPSSLVKSSSQVLLHMKLNSGLFS